MNIGFIVDASSKIGLGHWYRCINLSKIFKKNYFFKILSFRPKKLKNIQLIKIKKGEFDIKELKRKINKYTIEILIIDNYNFNLRPKTN